MSNRQKFYINGEWVKPSTGETLEVINPATEEPIDSIAMGGPADVDAAAAAARVAFETWSATTREERVAVMQRIIEVFKARMGDLAAVISEEMGAPMSLANAAQAPAGLGHFMTTLRVLRTFEFEQDIGTSHIIREPAGVCGFITPWNWPINQIACKVAPALAAGCTMVLKPSEVAPFNAIVFAEILDEAGVPAGVFNLVNGDGPTVGVALSAHPGIDMMSFTGSTRAGIEVARNAAPTVKRVAQELGGKSANIILDDADFATAISRDMFGMCLNSGQSCNAPSRMLVPKARMQEAAAIAKAAAEQVKVGDPQSRDTTIGPVVSSIQFEKIQNLIEKGIEEGATLETGGPGRPQGLNQGYYVKPTVFSNVSNDMTIAQEEIFGPVLSLIGYEDDEDAVRIANDTIGEQDQEARVPEKLALPKAPSLTLPEISSPLTVAENSSVIGMGDVMFAFHDKESPSAAPSSISIAPCAPAMFPVSELPSVASVIVADWGPMGVFVTVFQTPSTLLIGSFSYPLFQGGRRPI